ncbi:TrbC/VirB2 family protein [Maridesulfovibrio ferrireducens]|uniref:TrbC/VirB2 family protein n=1 Tax=Maridesulfovibrio ferrireducens TaxID=246191 RepID=UPI000B86E1C1|nr:TrbC/VirB2 family protein [Maridesulfovibrio ferrireducens]
MFTVKKNNLLLLLALVLIILMPENVFASNSISEFDSPFEAVVGTITGPVGRWISIAAMGLTGVTFVQKKDEIQGGFRLLLGVVFGIAFIAFASSIVDGLFSFSGAVL